jgi:hypothetical protein
VLSASAVLPAPPVVAAPVAPSVVSAPVAAPAPLVVAAPPAPPALSVVSAPVAAPVNPWAPPAPVVQASTAPVPAPIRTVFPVEVAAQVSAVIPFAARAAHASDVAEDESEDDDETMIVVRRMKPWTLETEHGLKVSLTKPVVLLGRNPARGGAHLDAQLVPLHDPGKTVSKTHARLDFVDGAWGISDLHSTNGVVLIDGGGFENELDAGASAPLTDRFLLGELAARIYLEA